MGGDLLLGEAGLLAQLRAAAAEVLGELAVGRRPPEVDRLNIGPCQGDGLSSIGAPRRPMTATDALKRHRTEILRLAAQYGATAIRVFGSVARGQADESSDIDFLVRMSPGRSLFDVGGLLMDLQDLLGKRVDIVTERGLGPRMRERVLREAIPV